MNLENLNLVELNALESQEIDGGVVGIDDVLLAGTIGFALLAIDNWSDIKKGARDAWYGRYPLEYRLAQSMSGKLL